MIPDFIVNLETIDTPTLSNAIEQLKVRPQSEGFTSLAIRSLFPEFGRMCGYAVTAQVETMTQTAPLNWDDFFTLFEAVAKAPKPAVVVLQETGGQRDFAAHCGEVMATVFTRLGAIGVVSDCGVRDLPEVRAMGMHYFARGSVASHAYFRIVRSSVPVQVDGVTIRPGDLLHGDENGLLLVPPCKPKALLEAVDQVRRREHELMEYVRGDGFSLKGLHQRLGHQPG